ncbi:TetR-like C-terminal domain-containing protein, partial [Mesorhizobium sp.]
RGRRAHTSSIVERAKARGEVSVDVDAEIVADLIASYAWRHLLTNRLDEDEATIRAAVRYVVRGIAA